MQSDEYRGSPILKPMTKMEAHQAFVGSSYSGKDRSDVSLLVIDEEHAIELQDVITVRRSNMSPRYKKPIACYASLAAMDGSLCPRRVDVIREICERLCERDETGVIVVDFKDDTRALWESMKALIAARN